MKALVVQPFLDLKVNKVREAGEVFTLSKARFAEINAKIPGYIKDATKAEEHD